MLDEARYKRKRNCLRVAHRPWSEVQLCKWHSFLKRDDLLSQKHVIICYKYCGNHFVMRNNHRYRLINSMNPIPTILPQIQKVINVSEASGIFQTQGNVLVRILSSPWPKFRSLENEGGQREAVWPSKAPEWKAGLTMRHAWHHEAHTHCSLCSGKPVRFVSSLWSLIYIHFIYFNKFS